MDSEKLDLSGLKLIDGKTLKMKYTEVVDRGATIQTLIGVDTTTAEVHTLYCLWTDGLAKEN